MDCETSASQCYVHVVYFKPDQKLAQLPERRHHSCLLEPHVLKTLVLLSHLVHESFTAQRLPASLGGLMNPREDLETMLLSSCLNL